jgi:CheY-like chemotaxis protein
MTEPKSVFISYQRKDTLCLAHVLYYALRHGQHQAFVDTGSIADGEIFREKIVTEDDVLPPHFRWFSRRNALKVRQSSLAADIDHCVSEVPALSAIPRRAARVLWIDDYPANNEKERRRLREYGIVFDNVVSTSEALAQLDNEIYDLVITDVGRESSSDKSRDAGTSFLRNPLLQNGPPVIVYTSVRQSAESGNLLRQGAADVTWSPEDLTAAVLKALGRDRMRTE